MGLWGGPAVFWRAREAEGAEGLVPVEGRVFGAIRGRGRAGGRVDGGNGLVLEAGRLVVLVQIALQGERLVATLAVEVFESRVCLHVSPQVGPVGKGLATVSASVWFVSCVTSHVALQEPRSRKRLATHVALVVEVVCEHVHREGGHADVHLVTDVALFGVV